MEVSVKDEEYQYARVSGMSHVFVSYQLNLQVIAGYLTVNTDNCLLSLGRQQLIRPLKFLPLFDKTRFFERRGGGLGKISKAQSGLAADG